ncbi:unnamed protein product [Thlaspi arvense]|uniref:Serpin domain-containing protein n=1 Tax=Thlaspi arvense TaxID=13288 RepID=A0AAU9SAK1_THLAR|nr:unnamed protein product [Thlaspi arvense]
MDLRESVGKQNEIVLQLAKHVIATTAGKPSNLVFSPALINVILSYIAAKCPGDTGDKIVSLLRASSTDELNAVSSEVVTNVLADSTAHGGPMISAANGFWIDKSLSVEPSFKDLLKTSYKAAFNQVDFRTKSDEVAKEVNSWVEKETKGLITDLLSPESVTPLTDFIFANALFFNGRWDEEFDPSLTKDSDFHLLDGTKARVPFMTGKSYRYSLEAYEGFNVLTLPYRQGSNYREDRRCFSMQIYLPDEKDGLPEMLDRLASCPGFLNGEGDISGERAEVGELKIPRFKFSFDFEASEALKGLGLDTPLETIIHKSCIEVDEVGSKAAAAAAVISVGACMPPKEMYDFVADHPFLFLVKEYGSGLVLFLGQGWLMYSPPVISWGINHERINLLTPSQFLSTMKFGCLYLTTPSSKWYEYRNLVAFVVTVSRSRKKMDLRESVGKQNEIVLQLAKHVIATTAGKPSNLVFSPALINVILSYIAAKCPGDTGDKIVSLLRASSTDELNAVSSEVVTNVLADSTAHGGPMISAANGFWIDKSLSVEPSFKDLLKTSYKAAFNQVDFRTKSDEVAKEVNSWVEKETKGLITDLLSPESVTPLTDFIFANALFFNGRWDEEFDPSLTKDSDFHLLDGTKARVPFMTGKSYRYSLEAYEGFNVLTLPYRQGSNYREDRRCFSMQIYLPDEKDGLPEMLDRLASCPGFLNGEGDISGERAEVGELKIPRFKFSFDFEASEALKGLGLDTPLETIIHKSCIEVDEVGSKAAAAAAVISVGACMPPKEMYDFVADHPFLFLVKEYGSGLVLFLGQVLDPSMH